MTRAWTTALLLISLQGIAQDFLSFKSAILSTQKSLDEQRIAVTTIDSVYILDALSLTPIKKFRHGLRFPTTHGFFPGNNNILLLQENNVGPDNTGTISAFNRLNFYQSYEKKWQETPGDSLHIWNIDQTQKIQSAPGNFYLQYGKGTKEMAGIFNRIFPNGYFRDSAEVFTQKGAFSLSTTRAMACRKLQVDDQTKHFAASWYVPRRGEGSSYTFSVHDFFTHNPVLELNELTDLPIDFRFSNDGKWIAVSGTFGKDKKQTTRLYDVPSGTLFNEIPLGSRFLHFSADDTGLEFLDEQGIWVEWDIEQQKKKGTIWSNLTGLFSFETVLPFGEQLICTGISGDYGAITPASTHRLERVGKKDLELFSSLDQPESRPLFDTSSFNLLLNDINPGTAHPILHFNADRTIFTLQSENQLQVWDAIQRKKIFQRQFNAPIKAYPDRSGRSILVVEERGQMTFSEYRLHRIHLSDNKLFTSGILTRTDSIFDGTSLSCDCTPDPKQDDTWTCIDGGSITWQIQGEKLRQSARAQIASKSILQYTQHKTGPSWLIAADKEGKRSIWKIADGSQDATFIRAIDQEQMTADGQGYWTWNTKKDTTIEYWENTERIRTDTLPGAIRSAEALPDQDGILVQFEQSSYTGWQRIAPKRKEPFVRSKWIGANIYPLQRDNILVEDEGLYSVKVNAETKLDWSVASPRILPTTNFSVSAGGRYILLGNTIVDLKEITQVKINTYHPAQLLQDTGKLHWVELIEDRNIQTGKSRYKLIRLENNGLDTLWGRTWFAPVMDGKTFFTERLTLSPNREWVVATWEPILSQATPPPPVLWNTKTLEGLELKGAHPSYYVRFSEDGSKLILRTYELVQGGLKQKERITYFSISPFKKIREIERLTETGSVQPTGSDQYIIKSRNVCWYKSMVDSAHLIKQFYSRDYLENVVFHPETGSIIAGTKQGTIHFWKRDGYRSPVNTLQLHQAAVLRLEVRGDRLYTLGEDGSMAIVRISSRQILARILTLQRTGEIAMAFYTPDGFYRADPGLSPLVHFVRNGNIYPLSTFEYQGNRPDKVYAALGFAEPSLLELLKKSWEARLHRANVPLTDKPIVSPYPRVEWNRSGLEPFAREKNLELAVNILDPESKQCQLFIRVNGVPVGGQKGETIALSKSQTSILRTIPLTIGKNRIGVRAVNEKGQESVEQEYEVVYEPDTKQIPRIFYAGVGVSSYADSNYNLRFAGKDVGDMAEKLNDYLDSVHHYTLTNQEATKNNILALRTWLKQAGTDDIVILSLSGHGMIDSSKGFVFAPHEMDFDDPAKSGVSMEELESLLDDIPARKRLLLLDACHSGETWSEPVQTARLPSGVSVTARGLKKEKSTSSNAVDKQAFLLMKELFSDLTRGNGAFMISAAGSTEFAFEGNEWKNGVFTLSLLESIRTLRYPEGSYERAPVPVSQLRRAIYERVQSLTRGMQNPTSRQENGWWDWSF